MTTTIYLGADHAGYALKEQLKRKLRLDFRIIDLGALRITPDDDYPDHARAVAQRIAKHESSGALGILVCGSSEGVCIAANKFNGIRAVSAWTQKHAILSREHNNANILCLSGWDLSVEKAERITRAFLTTPFSEEPRHIRRIKKITRLER